MRFTDDSGMPCAFIDVSMSDFRIPSGDDVMISTMLTELQWCSKSLKNCQIFHFIPELWRRSLDNNLLMPGGVKRDSNT